MRRSACYFPVIPNRMGEIIAVGHLSPRARTRARVVYEIDRPPETDAAGLEQHIAAAARQIGSVWGSAFPVLVDLPAYGPEHRTTSGSPALEHAFRCMRQLRIRAVPVAGPISARGPEVLEIMRDIAQHDRRGAALRVPFDELSHPEVLYRELDAAMRTLALKADEVDLLLDLEAVNHIPNNQRSVAYLTAVMLEALAVARAFGDYRNVVLCGSSVPENVGKEYNDFPYRGRRIELDVWRNLLLDAAWAVSFSDHGITPPRGDDPRGHGPAPARIRLSTPNEHVFYRAKSKEYADLCKRVVSSTDFDQEIEAWGATTLHDCARGYAKVSSSTVWVARDTNLHLETTLAEIERQLGRTGRMSDYRFPPQETFAWLQTSMLEQAT